MDIPSGKRTQYIDVGVLAVFALVQSFFVSPLFKIFHDVEMYRYIGMVINNGGLPYRDVFDHKPPVIYFIAALGDRLGGAWGYWALSTAIVTATSIFFYRLCRKLNCIYPLAYPICFIALMRFSAIAEFGQTRELTACLILSMFCLAVLAPRRYVLQGLIVSVIFFTQQNEILAAVPLAFMPLWTAPGLNSKVLISATLRITAGAGAGTALVLGYLGYNGILEDFWAHAIAYNTNVYLGTDNLWIGGTSVPARMLNTLRIMGNLGILIPFSALAAVTAVVCVGSRQRRDWFFPIIILGAAVLQLISSSLPNRPLYGYYYLSFVPLYCILLARLFAGTAVVASTTRKLLLACLLFCFIVPWHDLGMKGKLLALTGKYDPYDQVRSYAALVADLAGKRGTVHVFRDSWFIPILTDLRIVSPTKWILTQFYDESPSVDRGGLILSSIVDDLERVKPRFIFDFSISKPLPRRELRERWDGFVRSRYSAVFRDDTCILWRLRPSPKKL